MSKPRTGDQFDQKLRNRMLVRVLGAGALVLLVLASATYLVTRSLLLAELRSGSQGRVELAATRIDQWLEGRRQMLALLADREQRTPGTTAFRKTYFKELAHRYGGVGSVYLGRADGSYLTGSGWTPPPDYDPRRRPWYVLATRSQGVAFSKPYRDKHTGKLVVTMATALRKSGVLEGVLAMDMYIDDIVQIVAGLRVGSGSRAMLVDRQGVFVAHPNRERVLKGNIANTSDRAHFETHRRRSDRLRSAIYDGNDYVIITAVPTASWYLVFHLPKSEVNRPLTQLTWALLGGTLLALLVLFLVVAVISNRIARPVLHLAEGAGQIARGRYEVRLPVTRRDELGYLTSCFNDMGEGLKDREFIKSTFGRYVSPEVAREILDGAIDLGGDQKEITILFADIRRFTTLSEALAPQEVVGLLNSYFQVMDDCITAAGGSINKYLGDGLLAIFGAPTSLEDAPRAAVEAALKMREQLTEWNRDSDVTLSIGVGVHTGEAVVGNIGSEHRTEYTVIGDAVNLASRIESLTKVYGLELLVSETTAAALGHGYLHRTVDRVRVKGKAVPITLITPYPRAALSEAKQAFIERANQILERYFAGDFTAALEALDELDAPPDEHLTLIRERCIEYRDTPPRKWEGVFNQAIK